MFPHMFCLCSHCFFGVRTQYETLTHLGHQSAVDSPPSASLGLSLADFIQFKDIRFTLICRLHQHRPWHLFHLPDRNPGAALGHLASSPKLPLNEFSCSGFLIVRVLCAWVMSFRIVPCRLGHVLEWNLFIYYFVAHLPVWPRLDLHRLCLPMAGLQVCSITPRVFLCKSYINTSACI